MPNISVTLPDGKKTPKLVYTHNDIKNGPMKGVCSCAEGTYFRTCKKTYLSAKTGARVVTAAYLVVVLI